MSKELDKAFKHVFDRAREMGIWYELEYPHITKKLEEDIKIVEKALKRNEPMEVEIGTLKHFKFPICPNCKGELNEYYKNKYCKDCGQALDWSDEQ